MNMAVDEAWKLSVLKSQEADTLVKDAGIIHSDSFWQSMPSAAARSLSKSMVSPGKTAHVARPMHRVLDVDLASDIADYYPQVLDTKPLC